MRLRSTSCNATSPVCHFVPFQLCHPFPWNFPTNRLAEGIWWWNSSRPKWNSKSESGTIIGMMEQQSRNLSSSELHLKVAKLKGRRGLCYHLRGLFQRPWRFLFSLSSNYLKQIWIIGILWSLILVSQRLTNLCPSFSSCFCLCGHSSLQLHWQTSIFSVIRNVFLHSFVYTFKALALHFHSFHFDTPCCSGFVQDSLERK